MIRRSSARLLGNPHAIVIGASVAFLLAASRLAKPYEFAGDKLWGAGIC